MLNPFFKNVGPFKIDKLLSKMGIENKEKFKKDKIHNVADLLSATNKDLTFFHSKNYAELASKTAELQVLKTTSGGIESDNTSKKW